MPVGLKPAFKNGVHKGILISTSVSPPCSIPTSTPPSHIHAHTPVLPLATSTLATTRMRPATGVRVGSVVQFWVSKVNILPCWRPCSTAPHLTSRLDFLFPFPSSSTFILLDILVEHYRSVYAISNIQLTACQLHQQTSTADTHPLESACT